MKYLGKNLTKYVPGPSEENYKTLMNRIKELNKWRDIPCSQIERLNIVKMLVLTNMICRFNTIPIKIPASYFMDIDKLILKFVWRGKKTPNNSVLKKNEVEGLTLPNLQT